MDDGMMLIASVVSNMSWRLGARPLKGCTWLVYVLGLRCVRWPYASAKGPWVMKGVFLNGFSILTTSRFEIHSVHSVVSTPHPVTATVRSSKFSLWLQDLVMDLIPKELERVRTALKIRYGHLAEFLAKLEDIDGWMMDGQFSIQSKLLVTIQGLAVIMTSWMELFLSSLWGQDLNDTEAHFFDECQHCVL